MHEDEVEVTDASEKVQVAPIDEITIPVGNITSIIPPDGISC